VWRISMHMRIPCTCAHACMRVHTDAHVYTCSDMYGCACTFQGCTSGCVCMRLSLSLSLSLCMCVSVSCVYTSTYTNAPNFTPTHVPTRTCALTHTDTDAHNAHPTERAGASVYSHICDCENCMSQVEISLNPTAQTLTLKPSHSNLALPHRDALA